jgi:DNA (cytosine-5)-methyltransferase 1
MEERAIRTIDLFAGAGGLSLGFHLAESGFEPVMAVESESAAARTFKTNFAGQLAVPVNVIDAPIQTVEKYPEAEVVIGGPPCQGFSPLGRDRDPSSRALLNELWQEYVRAVLQVKPRAFVIENVPEFLKSVQFQTLLQRLNTDRRLRKYKFSYGVLNAADYGVPQRRRRGLFVASIDHQPCWPPQTTHGPESPDQRPYRTVRDAIGDLPLRPTGEDWHIGRNPLPSSIERYKAVPEGGNRFDLQRNRPDLTPQCWLNKPTGTTDVFGRLWWDRPAFTIRTEFFKPEKGRYLHPKAHRPITHREAARLMTFPDWFAFEGSKIEVARQIGNAVPPALGTEIARFVRKLLPE